MDRAATDLPALLCILLILVSLALLIGAVILRTACWMCGVQTPGLLKAMGILLLAAIANTAARYGAYYMLAGIMGAGVGAKTIQAASGLVAFAIGMLASAAIYSRFLAVSYGKAIVVYLAQILVTIIVVFIVAAIYAVLFLALRK